jgi:hypothetical protein
MFYPAFKRHIVPKQEQIIVLGTITKRAIISIVAVFTHLPRLDFIGISRRTIPAWVIARHKVADGATTLIAAKPAIPLFN